MPLYVVMFNLIEIESFVAEHIIRNILTGGDFITRPYMAIDDMLSICFYISQKYVVLEGTGRSITEGYGSTFYCILMRGSFLTFFTLTYAHRAPVSKTEVSSFISFLHARYVL